MLKKLLHVLQNRNTMMSQTFLLERIYKDQVMIDAAESKEHRRLVTSLLMDTLIPKVILEFNWSTGIENQLMKGF